MTTLGGGWTSLNQSYAASLSTSQLRNYLYTAKGRWYMSPKTQLGWSYTSGQVQLGVYSYFTGSTTSSFACQSSGEGMDYGKGP